MTCVKPTKFKLFLIATVITLFYANRSCPVNAELVPMFNLANVLAASDLVACVQSTSTPNQCRVLTVLAGDDTAVNTNFRLFIDKHNGDPNLLIALKNKQRVCVFLKRDRITPTVFHQSNEYYSWFRIGPKLAAVQNKGQEAIEDQLLLDLTSEDENVVNDAAVWLDYLKSVKGQKEIARMAQSANPPAPVYASYLLRQVPLGDKQILQKAIIFTSASANKNDPVLADRLWKISYAFASIKSTNDVPYLNHLLVQQGGEVSRWLADSARYWGDNSSVPYLMLKLTQYNSQRLAETGASSDEREVPFDAEQACVSALSTVVGQPGPTIYFPDEPDKSYAEWQHWWKEVGHMRFGNA